MATPMLLYGSETWALNRSDKRKIKTAEMRFLRYIAGYNRQDELSYLAIGSELQICNISDKIKEEIDWYDHIQWMDSYRIVCKAVEYKPIGHGDFGRLRRRWEDEFQRFLCDWNRSYGLP
jgi:hypothetical protein